MNAGKKILVVDDEVKLLEVLEDFLAGKGFVVFTAQNGEEALAVFEREDIALVLLDLMLPKISGEDVCTKIRQKSRVPIIMLTAKAQEAEVEAGLWIGADDYITKPFSLKILYARIVAILRRLSEEPVPLYNKIVFQDGQLEIDFESRSVRKSGAEVKLTPNEYKLLSAFVKYPGKVFTRDELIEFSFGTEFCGYDRAVDSHIKNLRQKIERDPKRPVYIQTVHGVGYKFGGK